MLKRKSDRQKGIELMAKGAKLFFASESERDELKEAINHETYLGSMSESGGHIHGGMNPMNEFDTQSVINVLRHSMLAKEKPKPVSEQFTYFKEKWLV